MMFLEKIIVSWIITQMIYNEFDSTVYYSKYSFFSLDLYLITDREIKMGIIEMKEKGWKVKVDKFFVRFVAILWKNEKQRKETKRCQRQRNFHQTIK